MYRCLFSEVDADRLHARVVDIMPPRRVQQAARSKFMDGGELGLGCEFEGGYEWGGRTKGLEESRGGSWRKWYERWE